MVNKNYSVMIGVVLLLLISSISANGLTIISNSSIALNKTINVDKAISFSLKNEEPFTFYNITFETNDIISMPKIDILNSGETLNITAVVTTNEDFNNILRLKGFYEANLGTGTPTNYDITVDFNEGLSKCDFSIIKGDSVNWQNLVNDEVRLRNEDTMEYINTILQNGSYQTNFDTPEVFRYAFYRRGYLFTNICTITVLDNVGLINDPNLDAILDLNVNVNYEPTTIATTFLETSYSMDFYRNQEGAFTVKNTGTKVAKNIQLSGDWFSFSKNSFDLDIDESKVVVYTISPAIFNTSETNQSYNKNLTISGNFNSVIKNFDIFINYAEIDENFNYSNGSSGLTYLIDQYCKDHPDICSPEPRIIYRNADNDTNSFNVSFEQGQFKDFISLVFDTLDEIKVALNYFKSDKEFYSSQINTTNSKISALEVSINQEKLSRETNTDNSFFILLILSIVAVAILFGFIVWLLAKNKRAKKYDTVS